MRNTYRYLYNIGGKDIIRHLAFLETIGMDTRIYYDGKQAKKLRKQTFIRKGQNEL